MVETIQTRLDKSEKKMELMATTLWNPKREGTSKIHNVKHQVP